MKNKLRLLVCFLLVCALVPLNFAFAANPIDRDGDGIHIDDIVYHLSHTEASTPYIISLLDHIGSVIPSPTADEVAAGITSVMTPVADQTSLRLPNVPYGYTIEIFNSSHPEVVGTDSEIIPPTDEISVELEFTVTRISDISTANTSLISVTIPAHVPTPAPAWITTGGVVTASGENMNGEEKEKAFDGNTSTKWYTSTSTGWIQYQLPAAHIVTQYSISSANDVPRRDPKDWTLKGSNDGVNWKELDMRTGETFEKRFQTNTYAIINSASYSYYRLDVLANQGESVLQISEIALFGRPAPPTEVIDLSNGAYYGTSFGSITGQVKRWQTFTAKSYSNLTSIDVKIRKNVGITQTDVTAQLFATLNDKPNGPALASTRISSSLVGISFSPINARLIYNGLINGTKYAIVLGQKTFSESNFEWATGSSVITGQNFGKFDGASTWTDETSIGLAWLKVYVN